LFRLILEEEGYEVHLSKIAFEEVREVEKLSPDLIILDIKIGRHNEGLLLLQQLRMYRPTMKIPVLICTAAISVIREQEEILQHKGIPVLYKPFDVDELLHVVQQCLLPSETKDY
jgi:CheY-like chemotaxis protein